MPSCRKYPSEEFRTVLRVVEQRYLAGGDDTSPKLRTQERYDETRERQSALNAILKEVLIAVTFQSADGLIGASQLHAQHLRTFKQISVLICQCSSCSKIARRVRSLRLETDSRRFVGLYLYMSIEQRGIGHLLVANVRIFHSTQAAKVVVGVL